MILNLLMASLLASASPAEALPAKNAQAAKRAKEAATPRILSARGKALVKTGRDEALREARAGQRLVERAELQTGADGSLKIQLDSERVITLLGGTQVTIPGIGWEGGDTPLVTLERGRLRWVSKTKDLKVRLQSGLFDLPPGEGDFVFRFTPGAPEAELQVLAGRQEFSASNAEDSAVVKERERVVFHGTLEDGEIAADILLQGKRIPRGKLDAVVKMTEAEVAPYFAEETKAKEAEKKARERDLRRAADDRRDGVICSAPRGRLNECSWTCEGNPKGAKSCQFGKASCVRRRCNANGQWAEPSVLSADDARLRCRTEPLVAACDY